MRKLNIIQEKFNKGRIFFIECISPIDALSGINEVSSLRNICDQIGHKTAFFPVKCVSEFKSTCSYIGSMRYYEDVDNKKTIFVHLSMHGSKKGLAFGSEDLKWEKLFSFVQPICKMKYPGEKIFTISACHAMNQKLSISITKNYKKSKNFVPPSYIFITDNEEVSFADAIVGWTILFHQLPNISLDNYERVKGLLNSIKELGIVKFKYYRWDITRKKYKFYEVTT